jgi:hypothetical protein
LVSRKKIPILQYPESSHKLHTRFGINPISSGGGLGGASAGIGAIKMLIKMRE